MEKFLRRCIHERGKEEKRKIWILADNKTKAGSLRVLSGSGASTETQTCVNKRKHIQKNQQKITTKKNSEKKKSLKKKKQMREECKKEKP